MPGQAVVPGVREAGSTSDPGLILALGERDVRTFDKVGFRLAATLVLSLLYFGVGVLVFQRLRMRDTA